MKKTSTFQERAAEVRATYSIKLLARGTMNRGGAALRVYRVSHPTDPARSYLVQLGAGAGCSCPSFQRDGRTCKHLHAAAGFEAASRVKPSPGPDWNAVPSRSSFEAVTPPVIGRVTVMASGPEDW